MDVLLTIADLLLTVLWVAILARTLLGWLLINHEHENPPLLRASARSRTRSCSPCGVSFHRAACST